jgi:hypothetical protein
MRRFNKSFRVMLASVTLLAFWCAGAAHAADNQGVKKCSECHESEVKVWEGTAHKASFPKPLAAVSR